MRFGQPGPVRVSVQEPFSVSVVVPVTSVSPVHRQLLDTIGLPLTAPPAPPSWPPSWLTLRGPTGGGRDGLRQTSVRFCPSSVTVPALAPPVSPRYCWPRPVASRWVPSPGLPGGQAQPATVQYGPPVPRTASRPLPSVIRPLVPAPGATVITCASTSSCSPVAPNSLALTVSESPSRSRAVRRAGWYRGRFGPVEVHATPGYRPCTKPPPHESRNAGVTPA